MLRNVDESALSDGWKRIVRLAAPIATILLPVAFFLSILSPKATEPNGLIYLGYAGAALSAVGLFVLGVGLARKAIST